MVWSSLVRSLLRLASGRRCSGATLSSAGGDVEVVLLLKNTDLVGDRAGVVEALGSSDLSGIDLKIVRCGTSWTGECVELGSALH